MLTKTSKWILFISSYIPLYMIFIVSNIFDIHSNYEELILSNIYNSQLLIENSKVNIFLIVIFFNLTIISYILLILILKLASNSSEYIDMYEISKNNSSINEYILVYILPFISVQTNDYKELSIFIMVFLLIGIISVKNDMVYINPILYIMKYNIYTFKKENNSAEHCILISKFTLVELRRNINIQTGKCINRSSLLGEGVYYKKHLE